jgi:hypothetical protein
MKSPVEVRLNIEFVDVPAVKLNIPLEVIPVAAAIAPVEFTWNKSPEPTVKSAVGEVSPTPTLPASNIAA